MPTKQRWTKAARAAEFGIIATKPEAKRERARKAKKPAVIHSRPPRSTEEEKVANPLWYIHDTLRDIEESIANHRREITKLTWLHDQVREQLREKLLDATTALTPEVKHGE